VQAKRAEFRQEVGTIATRRLVFVDETGVTTIMTPASGRAPRGQRVVDSVPASWETMTVIAALGLEAVRAPVVFTGSTDTAVFPAYVDQVLVPELRAGDVVVFDDIKPHLSAAVAKSIEGAGAGVRPLPPSSPDSTPIEEMFSQLKQGLRRAEARTKAGLVEAVGEVLKSVTRQDIRGWFEHAGLCATPG
jgi:transposase